MWQYLKSRKFLFTVGGILLVSALLFVLFFFVFLPIYTRHGKSVVVPEVTQKTLAEATAELEAAGLRFEVADSIFKPDLPALSIVSQEPLGLSKVKPGRKIFLVVNKGVAPMVKVPEKITGVSNYQAKLTLESMGLNLEETKYISGPYPNLVDRITWKGKDLKPGMEIPVGSRVVVYVFRGDHVKVEVPDLVGQPYENAISILHQLGLGLGEIRFKPDSPDLPGTVVMQTPGFSPGDSVMLGSEVFLYVAGQEPTEAVENIESQPDTAVNRNAPEPPDGL